MSRAHNDECTLFEDHLGQCGWEWHHPGCTRPFMSHENGCPTQIMVSADDVGTQYVKAPETVRTFDTGATRDTEEGKLDYEGFLSPEVLQRYAEYMHEHRLQKDGSIRDSANWQAGMPLAVYMKSLVRHVMEAWRTYRRGLLVAAMMGATTAVKTPDRTKAELDTMCAILFNTMGYMLQRIRGENE